MTFWLLAGFFSLVALAFVLLPILKPKLGNKKLIVFAVVVGLPLIAVLAYQKIGHPDIAVQAPLAVMPAEPSSMPPGHPSANAMNMDLSQLAAKLAEKLEKNPNHPDGWALLARTYVELKRHKDALPAFEKASSVMDKDPDLLADYADAIAMTNNGVFDQKSITLVDKALAVNPHHVKSLMLKATIAFNHKEYKVAIESWEKILKTPDLDPETSKQASGSIEEAKRMMGAKQ
jgi:cytochrome c-type biogenesis protein CcmH